MSNLSSEEQIELLSIVKGMITGGHDITMSRKIRDLVLEKGDTAVTDGPETVIPLDESVFGELIPVPLSSFEQNILIMDMAKELLANSCIPGDPDVPAAFKMVRDLVLEPDQSQLLYGIAKSPDGAVELTIFQDGDAATIKLTPAVMEQMLSEINDQLADFESNPDPSGTDKIGVNFDVDNGPPRGFLLSIEAAIRLAETIREYLEPVLEHVLEPVSNG